MEWNEMEWNSVPSLTIPSGIPACVLVGLCERSPPKIKKMMKEEEITSACRRRRTQLLLERSFVPICLYATKKEGMISWCFLSFIWLTGHLAWSLIILVREDVPWIVSKCDNEEITSACHRRRTQLLLERSFVPICLYATKKRG
jgi:hypothetical protein